MGLLSRRDRRGVVAEWTGGVASPANIYDVRERSVAAVSRDLVHRPFCLHQQTAGAGHTELVDVVGNSASRGPFEQATEGAFAQVGQAGQFRRVQRLSQVFFNVLADTADAVRVRAAGAMLNAG
jgi:hypothetical protein